LRNILAKVKEQFSGNRAFAHVAEVAQHHRIQASPGFREAAEYCQKVFQGHSIEAEILSYPADGKTTYWTQQMMEEWHCEEATLDLISPTKERLACFADNAFSLIQRSISTPKEGVVADVILLDCGDNPEPYADLDLSGSIVFTNGDINKVRAWAVEERGAIGIISDRLVEFAPVRHRYDIPDALQYTSFWWTGHEKQCFGFVLSPKAGDRLRQTCRRLREEHAQDSTKPKYPQVRAFVQSSLYSGHIENVAALIPGQTEEEIIIAAHLCHPKASANDNASGVGVALETARTLNSLIASGELPKPRRSIRILLIPEMTGTYAYLATNEERIPQMLAAINLDMVGENQDLCKGPLVAEYPPEAAGSFVGDLLAAIMEEVAAESKNLAGTSSYALFKHATAPFSGGSDHYILSDPTVGVPCPMLIQWPDKYYHTSEDTLDKVDPAMLYRVGCMTATYVYLLANMGLAEAKWILSESRGRYLGQLHRLLNNSAEQQLQAVSEAELLTTRQRVQYKLERRQAELSSINRFLTPEEQAEFERPLQAEFDFLRQVTHSLWQHHLEELGVDTLAEPSPPASGDYQLVPRRLFRGPISMRGKLETLSPADRQAYEELTRKHAEAARRANYLVYWADGQRTIAEIDHLVQMETGISDLAFALNYFRFLEKLGLVACQ
jgi:aminopeptidase YwaD